LKFAKDGILDIPYVGDRPPDSDFEIAVMDALRVAGFDVVPQVGVAGYFIDLAVRHPEKPGEFVLGVECDGATYHSSKSARDRDRLRQEVLENQKWRIHRIWSLDWYRNAKRETERVVKAVGEALASQR
jgi:very-short-patch-repair endonuclease